MAPARSRASFVRQPELAASEEPSGPVLWSPLPRAELERKRMDFEARNETSEEARHRLRRLVGPRRTLSEKEKFQDMMQKMGGGSVTIAWRRYFDQDGDGELSFREFCSALATIGYLGDSIALWHALGGSHHNTLTLRALDPEGAEVLDHFGRWCLTALGGPFEVFCALDDDGSDSLTMEEFVEGLTRLRFFETPDVPLSVATEERAKQTLYAFLDQNGCGAISASHLLFLEKDKLKRQRIQKDLVRMREHGSSAPTEPLPKAAEQVLKFGKCLLQDIWMKKEEDSKLAQTPGCHRARKRPVSAPTGGRAPRKRSGAGGLDTPLPGRRSVPTSAGCGRSLPRSPSAGSAGARIAGSTAAAVSPSSTMSTAPSPSVARHRPLSAGNLQTKLPRSPSAPAHTLQAAWG